MYSYVWFCDLLSTCLILSSRFFSKHIASLLILLEFLKLLHCLTFATVFSCFHYSIRIDVTSLNVCPAQRPHIQKKLKQFYITIKMSTNVI